MAKADDIDTMLEKLPEEEREEARVLLEKLYAAVPEDQSIFPAQQSKKIPKNTLEEYYLIIESTCKLCSSVITAFYLMKENGCGGLGSTELKMLPANTGGLGVKMEEKQILTCPKCRGALFMWPVHRLIDELIKARSMK